MSTILRMEPALTSLLKATLLSKDDLFLKETGRRTRTSSPMLLLIASTAPTTMPRTAVGPFCGLPRQCREEAGGELRVRQQLTQVTFIVKLTSAE
jgi:hypothetical protein